MEFVLMDSTRYIIAKHVSDVFRKEPRNIGIIVWSELGIEWRFWGLDSFGAFDGRKIPEFVNSKNAYQHWITFWVKELSKPQIEFIGSGKIVPVQSPEFIQAIQSGNSANFFLEEGGSILEPIPKEGLRALADELFETIVTAEVIDEPDTSTLIKEECEKIIKKTRLSDSRNFRRSQMLYPTIHSPRGDVVERIEFSYGYGNGAPVWLGHRVALKRYKSQLGAQAILGCWRFDRAIREGFITADRGAAFVCPTEEQLGDADITKALAVLGTVTNVFDVRDEQSVKREFEKVAAIPVAETH